MAGTWDFSPAGGGVCRVCGETAYRGLNRRA